MLKPKNVAIFHLIFFPSLIASSLYYGDNQKSEGGCENRDASGCVKNVMSEVKRSSCVCFWRWAQSSSVLYKFLMRSRLKPSAVNLDQFKSNSWEELSKDNGPHKP